MRNYLHSFSTFFLTNSKAIVVTTILLLFGYGSVRATGEAPEKAPTVLTVSVSSALVCAGASTTLTAAGCPANGAIRWSTAQAGASIAVAPQQTTTYTAICNVTSTSVATTTAVSTTATSSTAVSTTAIISTTALVSTVTSTSATGTVQVHPPIVLTPESTSPLCNGATTGRIVLNASGGTGTLQYQFGSDPFQSSSTFGNLKAGTYPVAVRDGIGCITRANAVVTQPPPLSVTVTPVAAKCTGGADGGLIAVGAGGIGDYRYILNNGTPQISGTFVNLQGNTEYLLIVADKNSCVLYQPVFIGAPTSSTITITPKPTRCSGSADGSVTISATGGTGNYQFQLGTNPFQPGPQFTGLSAKTYEFTVLDGNGCTTKRSITIEQPAPLKLTASSGPVNCFGPNSGFIAVTPSGGTGAVTYQLTPSATPATGNVFKGIAVGDYTVVGTDVNGCTSLVPITVGKSDPLKVQAVPLPATCCVCPTGAVSLTSTGGTGMARQYQVIGQAYQASPQIGGLRPNTYRFRVIDEVGCTDSVVAVVTNGGGLTLAVGTTKDVACTGGRDGEATVQVVGGTKPFIYYWTTERKDTLKNLTATQTALAEGTYTVSVLDSNRCSTTTTFVTIKAQFPLPDKPTISQVGSSTLTVRDQPAGVQWYVRTGADPGKPVPNAIGPALVPFESGQYYAVVTANGCASPPSDAINFILTALPDPASTLSVRVMPNPILDRLRLEIEQAERSPVQVQLLDASGRPVMSGQISAFVGKKQAEWPLTGVSTGTYLLKVNANSRQSLIRVLVE